MMLAVEWCARDFFDEVIEKAGCSFITVLMAISNDIC